MTADLVLALDVGTQSVRAALVGPGGDVVAMRRVPFEPYLPGRPGVAEQDPELYWNSLGDACSGLWAEAAAATRRADVAAVTLTTQRGTVVVADRDGRPLRPAIVWLDQRRADGIRPIGGLTGLGFGLVGARGIVAGFQAECEANWLVRHEPETWRSIRRYGFLSAWLTDRLTGRWVDSTAAQVGYVPFDARAFRWAAPGDWRWQLAPIDPAWLPELVPPTGRLGDLAAPAAEVLGIPAGTPVIAAAADKACEALGSGAVEPHVASLSLGTAATVNVTTERYVEAIRLVPPFPSAVPGRYSAEVAIYRGFWLVEWFRHEFGLREEETAVRLEVAQELLFDELVRETPPGAGGLLLMPTWSPGHRVPGPEARGAIVGWAPHHTRAHLYRAILEGLAFALREGGERISRATGVPLREIRASGGGSQSASAVQILADVFRLPVGRPHTHETAAVGAATDAFVGLGWYPDVPTAARGMTRIAETREPDPVAAELYEEIYSRAYRPLYPRLRPIFRQLRKLARRRRAAEATRTARRAPPGA